MLRFITATSLFDGHDASINIMRRLLQQQGVEVIHLGHNRGVEEIVDAAIQEDVNGIAISSYQGGHTEFFKYMIDLLKEKQASHIKVFGGGGGVIIPSEITELMEYGVTRIYSPEDGQQLGLIGMIEDIVKHTPEHSSSPDFQPNLTLLQQHNWKHLTECLTWAEKQNPTEIPSPSSQAPIIGLTGTGGAGKSCLTDEVLRRFLAEYPEFHIAILSVDPSRRKTGGALLGDRIRMNSIDPKRVFMRSIATRRSNHSVSSSLNKMLQCLQLGNFDLILLETAGIGQSDSEIVDLVDLSVYVMTSEFGAATQLEKIDMLDFADLVVINKFDKQGSKDALMAVQKQYRRNHTCFETPLEQLPVYGTIANQFNDTATNWFYYNLVNQIISKKSLSWKRHYEASPELSSASSIVPSDRKNYLQEIAQSIRHYKQQLQQQSEIASQCYQLYETLNQLSEEPTNAPLETLQNEKLPQELQIIGKHYQQKLSRLTPDSQQQLQQYWQHTPQYQKPEYIYQVGQKELRVDNQTESLSGLKIPKISSPQFRDWGDLLSWTGLENYPGTFPYTAGVFPFKRAGEDPTRMFAGEGGPERTNQRFHLLASGQKGARLSTAFDSVTLYGSDPHKRPDIYGKVGNAGVSICTVDDAKRLYSGFDLCDPSTSVSMTINGPAPTILAFFMNAAIDQQVEKYLQSEGTMNKAKQYLEKLYQDKGVSPPAYRSTLPEVHNQLGLQTLGISGDQLVSKDVYENIKADVFSKVRGTVQADILKEDQAQNTCIFSTEFALRMMGDIQEYFSHRKVRYFYSVSISGYHIAEAGANPITQVAFTLANGFTLIEYYLSRGLHIDQFAHNLSFFFSNGMDPEYAVIGRVARRIFAIALRNRYGANERSQKLKYHIQTSGRSLHAQEIDFNDIRTTLQALYAIYDNCNSLHTNAYDEAITTPTEESVRRALAIQMIINRELGLAKNENPLQGSFIIEELTELVEEAILTEFVRISERGGVLGAMETMYQRNKIQEESLHYEHLKHSGELPIIGVNTFLNPSPQPSGDEIELARSTDEEKQHQLKSLEQFHQAHQEQSEQALQSLKDSCLKGENAFEELLECVKYCSLGQISNELYHIGGQYRRSM